MMMQPPDQGTAAMQNYQYLLSQGVDPQDALGRAFSGGVTVNAGGQGVPGLSKLGEGYAYRYNPDGTPMLDENGLPMAAPVTGGPKDNSAKEANKDRQANLKLGTTLTSIGLNIDEIENGGLPVTGAVGDFRRTNIGRTLTGASAVDFDNRTNQITDSAAFAEIQNMRDNSPTGGAVGQLTDKERAAIGNAVTALNSSTSADEYLRAAKAYRKLALDPCLWRGQLATDGRRRPAG